MSIIQITSLVFAIFVFALNIYSYFFGLANYKNLTNTTYSLLNRFPYELTDISEKKSTVVTRYIYVAASSLSLLPLIIVNSLNIFSTLIYPYLLVSSFLLLISGIVRSIIFFTKTTIIKQFLALFSILLISTLGSLFIFLTGIVLLIITFSDYLGVLTIISLVISSILICILLFIIFSPKTYKWYILEKDENDNVKLPKIISLALSEHVVIFVSIAAICMILLFMAFFSPII